MIQKNIFVPTTNAESWKPLLGDPEKHWRDGYSAKSVAESWEKESGVPRKISNILEMVPEFSGAELLMAFPEYKVPLPGGSHPSQNDVFAVLSNAHGVLSMMVEAKAREDFDCTIEEWSAYASDGKKERLAFLLEKISYPDIAISRMRYQLFHRFASAVIMAEKLHANYALMVVQSFEQDDELNHYADFESFIIPYGVAATKNSVISLGTVKGIHRYALWVSM